MKVNRKLLPVKLHYFFFMAASGAVLPYLQVMGRALGASEVAMGSVTALLPPLFLLAKPLFGLLADHFTAHRSRLFLMVLAGQNVAFGCLYWVPCTNCTTANNMTSSADNITSLANNSISLASNSTSLANNGTTTSNPSESLYSSASWWCFVGLLALGTIFYNVANSVSDAITFDILGDGCEMSYGEQRVWGTVGFGLSGLLSGSAMQWWHTDYEPALALAVVFGVVDLLVCQYHLKMPPLPRSERILRDVGSLVSRPNVAVFLVFAAVCGALDGFVVYYLFWFLEERAEVSSSHSVKLIEGLVLAAETLLGETAFFYLSGAILARLGSQGRHTHARGLSLALAAYALRCALVSAASSPWHLLPIEALMQGPSYALSYSAIVGYAASVSPPGASATVQGLVAGVDDGLGYAVGSLLGGVLYKYAGGAVAFRVFAAVAAVSAVSHLAVYELKLKKDHGDQVPVGYSAAAVTEEEGTGANGAQ
ncbi:major facilitator superfamily domain-containing protein 6-B isoform X2 [Ischnura elegans]|uniref:major facilitator superfamily domain-containing protein 6-B isoform X2 n=1 Tax=Ischnura elegans TaxID=197161 RepID=UPI001ED869A2|nr:major facilitator superfamily domain-containing protein 6-B isoform X2 [Ischnura elegans]